MARGINKVILIGNLGADPETRYTPNGTAVANLNLATDESYKDRQTGQLVPRTEWHRVCLFGKIAEVAGQYLKKGAKIYIEGRLRTRKWQNQSGQDVWTTEIVVDIGGAMQMLDSRQGDQGGQASRGGTSGQGGGRSPQGGAAGGYQSAGQHATGANMPEPVDDFDDDIPFNHGQA